LERREYFTKIEGTRVMLENMALRGNIKCQLVIKINIGSPHVLGQLTTKKMRN